MKEGNDDVSRPDEAEALLSVPLVLDKAREGSASPVDGDGSAGVAQI